MLLGLPPYKIKIPMKRDTNLATMSSMAIVGGLDVPDILTGLFRDLMRVNDSRRYGSVAKHGYLMSKEKKRNVSTRSLLPEISALWASLSTSAKADWSNAADVTNYNGWNLFVQDTAYRLKYGIENLANPSQYHQYKVGRLEINAPADQALLKQYHPESYWKLQKVRGTKGQYEDVQIFEVLHLPLTFQLSYRCELSPTTASPIARGYATVYSSYQGQTIETRLQIDFDLSSNWTIASGLLTEVRGVARSYDLTLEFENVRGWFEWDNVFAIHSGSNFARDFRCSDVNNTLTRSNWQIEKSWEEEILPAGASFDSVYPQDEGVDYRYCGIAKNGEIPYS